MIAGRRRRSGLDLGRRQKPRVALWAVVVLVVAIVIGEVTADVVNSGGSAVEVAAKSYAAAVAPIIEESTALRLWLTDVRQNAVKLGRLGVETALGRLVAGTHNLELQLANLGLPPPSPRAARLLSLVLARRSTAARMVMGGVALAIGPSRDVTGATDTLVRAATEMAASDRDYARFLSSLPPYVRRSVSLPPSRWDSPPQWSATALARFASSLSRSPSLLIHRSLVIVAISLQPPALRIVGLPAVAGGSTTTSTTTTSTTTLPGAVTGSTVPGATTGPIPTTSTTSTTTTTLQVPPAGSVSCLQPTNRVSVNVVVANAGNVASTHVEVSATLTELAPQAAGSAKHRNPQAAGSTKRRKKKPTVNRRTTPSCQPGPGRASGGGSAGGQAAPGGPSTASAGLTVTYDVALLPAGSSQYVALSPMAVRGGRAYVLTVRLGSQHESVTLQVASG